MTLTSIETLVAALLLAMAVPDWCARWRRPALAYVLFVLFGLVLGPLLTEDALGTLTDIGHVGFVLLLFEVGLEIQLAAWSALRRPLKFAALWVLAQYPLLLALGRLAGLGWGECFVAAAALTACSVGMAHAAWKQQPGLSETTRNFVLQVMVVLEVAAILSLAIKGTALVKGFSVFLFVKLAGMALVVFLISRFADRLHGLFQRALERTTHWRVHWLVLLVLGVSALGERLGLSAAKTAFVLGLFLSRIEHDGRSLQHFLAPVSQRLLIPVFFIALGTQVPVGMLLSWPALLALGAAGVVLGWRGLLHRRLLPTGGGPDTHLLFGPNLTIVALAAGLLLEAGAAPGVTAWLLLTGLFITAASLVRLRGTADAPPSPLHFPSSIQTTTQPFPNHEP